LPWCTFSNSMVISSQVIWPTSSDTLGEEISVTPLGGQPPALFAGHLLKYSTQGNLFHVLTSSLICLKTLSISKIPPPIPQDLGETMSGDPAAIPWVIKLPDAS